MSLKLEGSSCARCKALLFSDDDVVYCPVCGAPHHRDCYAALGHCALEELHGTPMEYSREKVDEALAAKAESTENRSERAEQRICAVCGEAYPSDKGRCPNCGAPDTSRMNGFADFDFLGGVPADYRLDENVSAEDAKKFVLANSQRYVPKFAALNRLNRASWNWMAFLFPCGWMLSRKMLKSGIVAGLLQIIASVLRIPLTIAFYNLGAGAASSYSELAERMTEALPKLGGAVIAVTALGILIDIVLRVLSAIFGDYIYKSYAVEKIKTIKAESDDIAYDFHRKGGVSLWLFLLGTAAVNYLPSLISMLF